MPLNIDKLFATHSRARGLANQRLQLLAANVANSHTPNYEPRDVDFRATMQASGNEGQVRMGTTRPAHLQMVSQQNRADVLYRLPDQPSLDVNTVET